MLVVLFFRNFRLTEPVKYGCIIPTAHNCNLRFLYRIYLHDLFLLLLMQCIDRIQFRNLCSDIFPFQWNLFHLSEIRIMAESTYPAFRQHLSGNGCYQIQVMTNHQIRSELLCRLSN